MKQFAVILLVLNLIAITGFASPQLRFIGAKAGSQILGESSTTATYSLLIGWNLVHFPLKPDNFTTASELIKNVAQAGGYVTTIATWQDGAWKEYIQRGATAYSEDFPIEPGRAYFLRSHHETAWQVSGARTPITKLTLKPGWNSIGLTPSPDTNAVNILDALNGIKPSALSVKPSQELAPEIDHWLSGAWQVFVKRIYSESDIQEYGDNFALSEAKGYMLKSNDYLQLKLEHE